MPDIVACGKSDKGVKRDTNEDSFLVRKIGDIYLLAVADGLGGRSAGEVASKMALVELEETVKTCIGKVSEKEMLARAVAKANREIYLLSKENPEYRGMGTTLVVALVFSDMAVIANIGDSRAYLIGDGIKQITRDHSLVQEMVEQGAINGEDALQNPQKNIVTRVLGTELESNPDFFEITFVDNFLLLCSDGLNNSLTDVEILKIVNSFSKVEIVCDRLIAATNEKGSKDNVTVILAKERYE